VSPNKPQNFISRLYSNYSNLACPPDSLPVSPGWLFSTNGAERQADVLLCIFLRGAMDGLNVVVPFGDPDYYAARPTISIAAPAAGKVLTAQDLDGFFGLHPALKSLKSIWENGSLALIHASGSPDPSHSHFDAQEFMELGTPGEKKAAAGWLARHILSLPESNNSPFRALSIGTLVPRSLQGSVPAVALKSIADYRLGGKVGQNPAILKIGESLSQLYAGSSLLDQRARLTFEAIQYLQKVGASGYTPSSGAKYPDGEFGQGLKQIAQIIKAEIGLEIATLDVGGWDTHVQEGAAEGQLANLLNALGSGLAAFYQDLGDRFARITVVAMSEFGRRVQENGNGGTDHGHGNVMFVISNRLAAAKVWGQWPGLSKENLSGPGDLAVTTDFRTVLAELVQKRLKNPKISEVFPGFAAAPALGIFKE